MADGVFDPNFWSSVKQYVVNAGIEPLTLGETYEAIWDKIYRAMIVNGENVSRSSSRRDLLSALNAALTTGGGAPFGMQFLYDLDVSLMLDIDGKPVFEPR